MKKQLSYLALLLIVVVATASGCGQGAKGDRAEVIGQVTLNGTPLETGVITFLPADGKGASAGAPIVNGAYKAEVPPGAKKVSIYAEKVVGKQPRSPSNPGGDQIDVVQQLIPPQYNAQTTLQVDIPPEGKKDANFSLTTSAS